MCSLHLIHPSVHTWSSGQPTVQRPGSSRGLPARARIRTHNLGLPQVSSPTLYPLGQRLPPLGQRLPVLYRGHGSRHVCRPKSVNTRVQTKECKYHRLYHATPPGRDTGKGYKYRFLFMFFLTACFTSVLVFITNSYYVKNKYT